MSQETVLDNNIKNHKLPITAVVVIYNEQSILRRCLESLAFCDQIIAVDLGSKDDSVKIAQECGAEIMEHELVPFGEKVMPNVLPKARNNWILRLDPDEQFSDLLVDDLAREISMEDGSLALIKLPFVYYFRGKRLKTTRWGKIEYKTTLLYRGRVEIITAVHSGYAHCKPGYRATLIPATDDNPVRHYWIDTYEQLFEKHNRYIPYEGEARYAKGERFSWGHLIKETVLALKYNLISTRGLLGGFTGIFLSFFYSWYVARGLLSLRRHEKNKPA